MGDVAMEGIMKTYMSKLVLSLILAISLTGIMAPRSVQAGSPWYVRTDGNDTSCTGSVNAAYPGSGTEQPCAFKTIARGITAASAGDTVNVAGGTYTGAVTVSKAITVQGIESAFGANPAIINPAIINTDSVSVNGNGATFRNFKVTPGSVTGQIAAISVDASNTTVADNWVTGMTGDGSGTIKGIHIYGGGNAAAPITNITISGNQINQISRSSSGAADGIMVQGAVDGANITSNSIDNISAKASFFEYAGAIGIEVTQTNSGDYPAPVNVIIQRNLIKFINVSGTLIATAAGVMIETGTNASLTTVFANSITNVQNYIYNRDSRTLNASGNWFGSNTYTSFTGRLNGSIDYTPWMNVGTDLSTATGFQGDLSTLWVNTVSPQTPSDINRLTEAANMVEDGALTGGARLVRLVSGTATYTEAGTITRAVTVQGNGTSSSNVDDGASPTPSITIAADNVTLKGFNFRNATTSVRVSSGTGNIIRSNAFNTNATGIEVTGGDAAISANAFTGNTTAAVAVTGGSASVTANTGFTSNAIGVAVSGGTANISSNASWSNNTTGIKVSGSGSANIDGNTINNTTGSYSAVHVDGGSASIGLSAANTFTGKSSPYAGNGVLVSNGSAVVKGNSFSRYANSLSVTGGTLDAINNTFTNHTQALNVSGGTAYLGGDTWSERNNITGGIAALVSGGTAYVKGNTLSTNSTVFSSGGGMLLAYVNDVSGFTTACSGCSESTTILKHNYWGSNDPAAAMPGGLLAADWQARLGAPISDWAEGSGSVNLGGAQLSGAGLTQVVLHGDGATPTNRPFNNGIDPFVSQLCSDFYDFFTVGGSGSYDLSIPVDAASSCDYAFSSHALYWIPAATDYASDCNAPGNTACWDPLYATKTVGASGRNLTLNGLTPEELGGTQFVVGDINGMDPTAVELISLQASSRSSGMGWLFSLLGVGVLLGALLLLRQKK